MKVTNVRELRALYNDAKGSKEHFYTVEPFFIMCRKLENKEVDCVYVVYGEQTFVVGYNDPEKD